MIRELVALSLKFRVLVVGVAVVVIGLGVFQLRGASVDALPEFAPPTVTIQAEALGLSAAEVEQLITVPIEQDLLNGVQWLDHMASESAPGLSNIDLTFTPGTDPLKARQAVQERLTQAHALPAVGTPPVMLQPLSSTSRVMMVGMSAKDLSLTDLSVLARWKIRPRLMGIPGVANVSIWGQRDRQLQVQVDPDKLRQNGVTLNQVISTAGNALFVSPLNFLEASTPGTGGFVDTSTQRLAIQHVLPVTTAKNLSAVTIEDTNGRTLRLGDVASVVEDHQPLIGDAELSGGPGLMLVIQKFPEASTQEVTKGVEDALAGLRPGLSGITLDTGVYQARSFVDSALHNLGVTGLVSLALLLLVVGLLLFSWRMALITVLTVLLSLIAAAYVLQLRGASFNLMVLGGLAMALAVVIDDAVAGLGDVRSRLRELRASGASTSMVTVIAEASAAVRGPLLYGTLVALLAPLPLVFLDGVAGSFAKSIVVSYALAVAVSTLVAMAVTPALASLLLRGGALEQRTSPVIRLAQRAFDRTAPRLVERQRWAYALVAAMLAVGLAVLPQLNARAPLPTPQDRNLLVHWETAPGTSLTEMGRISASAIKELRSLSAVKDVGAHVGRALTADQVVDVNSGEMWVSLADSADYNRAVVEIGRVLHGYPGLRSQVDTYTQDRVNAVQSGTGSDLTVRVYGIDLPTLRSKAQEVSQQISKVDGVVRPKVQTQPEEPTLEVQVDLASAQRYGLVPGDVRRAASTFFAGTLVGNLYQDQRIFDVVVWGTPSTRLAPANLADLRIDTPAGDQVRLGDVASVKVVPYPTQIRHDASSRYVAVDAQVGGDRDLDAVLRDVRSRVATVKMPLEYHAEVVADLSQQQSQDRAMTGLAIAAAVVIFLLLQAAFGSWRLAGLAFLMLPLAAVGGGVGNLLTGGELSLAAMLGLFAVLGLTARHTVLLISGYRRLEAVEEVTHSAGVVLRVTRERLGSILLTSAATAAVFLPMAVAGGRAGTEVLYPMAAVVLGGLVTSTLLTLMVLPTLYLRLSPAVHLTGRAPLRARLRSRPEQATVNTRVGEG
jgi:CzcA family heavy metal efflux pump